MAHTLLRSAHSAVHRVVPSLVATPWRVVPVAVVCTAAAMLVPASGDETTKGVATCARSAVPVGNLSNPTLSTARLHTTAGAGSGGVVASPVASEPANASPPPPHDDGGSATPLGDAGSFKRCHWGTARAQGRRRYMEDRHAVVAVTDSDGAPNTRLLFLVLDGHGGSECAQYCTTTLPQVWADTRRESLRHPRRAKVDERTAAGESAAATMATVDLLYRRAFPRVCDTAGTTVSAVWVEQPSDQAGESDSSAAGPLLTVAWLGDSRIVLAGLDGEGKWNGVGLSQDHKPTDPAEKKRIEAAGGKVTPQSWRDCARVWCVVCVCVGRVEHALLTKNDAASCVQGPTWRPRHVAGTW